jgi:hypothetical protein
LHEGIDCLTARDETQQQQHLALDYAWIGVDASDTVHLFLEGVCHMESECLEEHLRHLRPFGVDGGNPASG